MTEEKVTLGSEGDIISVTVAPFTGGPFSLRISRNDSVEELKKAVAKKLKVLKDRICLLFRESQLSDGSLEENLVTDGARITLLPRTETGLLTQKPEQSVMQALESLNDSQVNDFLSGKAPLNLTMRLGDHMMLIQLQLSTVNSAAAAAAAAAAASSKRSSPTTSSTNSKNTSSASDRLADISEKYKPKLDSWALAEASKNLTQTLRQLSSEVLVNKTDSEARPRKRQRTTTRQSTSRDRNKVRSNSNSTSRDSCETSSKSSEQSKSKRRSGAIIESMHHHGKGVYSGTFSGTLNPALQDQHGLPKRDITTIIHILNDLLCAQYKSYNGCSRKNSSHSTQSSHKSSTSAPSSTSSNSSSSSSSTLPSSAEQLNITREKMEYLRRVMKERKAKRKAQREAKSSPYSTSWSVRSSNDSVASPLSSNASSTPPPSPQPPSNNNNTDPSPPIFEPEPVTA